MNLIPLLSNQTTLNGHVINTGVDSVMDKIMYIYMIVLISFFVLQFIFALAVILKRKTTFRMLLGVLSAIFLLASIPFFLPGSSFAWFGVIAVIMGIIGIFVSIKFKK
jgi:hypothetical protein